MFKDTNSKTFKHVKMNKLINEAFIGLLPLKDNFHRIVVARKNHGRLIDTFNSKNVHYIFIDPRSTHEISGVRCRP